MAVEMHLICTFIQDISCDIAQIHAILSLCDLCPKHDASVI